MLAVMIGLKKARETVEAAAANVTASAETASRAIVVAIGLAVGALLLACVAALIALSGRKALA